MKELSPWMDLSFRELSFLLELRQRQSLRVVSRDSRVAPSQLSKLIQRAEAAFGVTLFFRSSSGLTPNPEVEGLWKKIRAFVEGSSDFGVVTQREVSLSVSAPSFICQHVLTRLFSANPSLHSSRILEVSDKAALSLAYAGAMDAQVSLSLFEFPKVWETLKVGEIRSALFARTAHPLCRKGEREFENDSKSTVRGPFSESAISQYEFVSPLYFSESGLEYGYDLCPLPMQMRRKGVALSTAHTALDWIRFSDQLAFVPEIVARSSQNAGEVKEILCEEWEPVWKPVYFSYHTEKLKKNMARTLIEGMQAQLIRNVSF
jgi:DNA-binding transcriptional LysR family regulator